MKLNLKTYKSSYSDIISNNDIKHIAYVDASGDDGFSFSDIKGQGSSLCYTVAVFISDIENIEHNISILNNAKKLFGHTDLNNELKYTKLRRHYKSEQIHDEILNNIKGQLIIHNAFKKELNYDEKPILSGLCHALPLNALSKIYDNESHNTLIIVDRMKEVEQNNVSFIVNELEKDVYTNFPVLYMDSKDKKLTFNTNSRFFI